MRLRSSAIFLLTVEVSRKLSLSKSKTEKKFRINYEKYLLESNEIFLNI